MLNFHSQLPFHLSKRVVCERTNDCFSGFSTGATLHGKPTGFLNGDSSVLVEWSECTLFANSCIMFTFVFVFGHDVAFNIEGQIT